MLLSVRIIFDFLLEHMHKDARITVNVLKNQGDRLFTAQQIESIKQEVLESMRISKQEEQDRALQVSQTNIPTPQARPIPYNNTGLHAQAVSASSTSQEIEFKKLIQTPSFWENWRSMNYEEKAACVDQQIDLFRKVFSELADQIDIYSDVDDSISPAPAGSHRWQHLMNVKADDYFRTANIREVIEFFNFLSFYMYKNCSILYPRCFLRLENLIGLTYASLLRIDGDYPEKIWTYGPRDAPVFLFSLKLELTGDKLNLLKTFYIGDLSCPNLITFMNNANFDAKSLADYVTEEEFNELAQKTRLLFPDLIADIQGLSLSDKTQALFRELKRLCYSILNNERRYSNYLYIVKNDSGEYVKQIKNRFIG